MVFLLQATADYHCIWQLATICICIWQLATISILLLFVRLVVSRYSKNIFCDGFFFSVKKLFIRSDDVFN